MYKRVKERFQNLYNLIKIFANYLKTRNFWCIIRIGIRVICNFLSKGECIMYSALDIAKWFLAENRRRMIDGESDFLTHLKLQKLLYYAQGCHLAIKDKKLFGENIVAWAHGPVVEKVYSKYKDFGSSPIVFDEEYRQTIDATTEGILREVFDVFGQYSAWKLREMTHSEEPWKNTPRNGVIDTNLIKDYFKREYIA